MPARPEEKAELERRIEAIEGSIQEYLEDPGKIYDLEPEEQLDILSTFQLYYELRQALARMEHSEHSWQFMAAHADVNFWKNKVMNAKVKARVKISDKERGV